MLNAFNDYASKSKKLVARTLVENQDSDQLAYMFTEEIIRSFTDINGTYVTSYNSRPACRCLEENGLINDIVVIGHDIYPDLVEYIREEKLNCNCFSGSCDARENRS